LINDGPISIGPTACSSIAAISDEADPGLELLQINQPGVRELDDQLLFVAVDQHSS
jgi:hypothetical protein